MHTIRFEDHECDSELIDEIGGKNASLGELINAEVPVPAGFAVTTTFYRSFLDQSGVGEVVDKTLSGGDLSDVTAAQAASSDIQAAFDKVSFPAHLEGKLRDAWDDLIQQLGTTPSVAVRSSATAEDLPDASFAGQQDTYLNVQGFEAVKDRIKDCMGSLFTARAIAYREEHGFDHDDVLISVGIQKLVDVRSAGVMFTLNPSNGDQSKALVEANWGLGESVVSGQATPDSFLVEKPTFDIVEKEIVTKEIAIYRTDDETAEFDVDSEKQNQPALSNEELEELVKLGKRIERFYGDPQDIEWAIDSDKNIYILQSRPETVWSQEERSQSTTVDSAADSVLDSIQ
jgi:pyruvate,water dikinase